MANFHMVNALSMNIKDSRWLQLEVCREYQRNKCSRSDTECKFAHPLPHVEVQNGKVTACFDSIKGRCNREKPPCKYFHPPQHLKEQLLINGRNNLAIKNALMQQFAAGSLPMAGTVPVASHGQLVLAYAGGGAEMTSPTAPMYSLPPSMSQFYTAAPTQAVGDAGLVAPLALPQLQQKMQRSDRLEVCREFQRGACKRAEQECRYAHPPDQVAVDDGQVTVCMDAVKGRCGREPCRYFHPPSHLQAQLRAPRASPAALGEPAYDAQVYFGAFPGMGVAYKRSAGDKAGIPCYPAPGAASYQQLMLQQQQQSYLHQTPCNNAHSVTYTDSLGQLLDNLPVCQDFRKGACVRPACKFVHYVPDHVEITSSNQVTVCRDSVRGKCARPRCKYYHLPVLPAGPGEPAASAAALGLHLL
ncbi:muscleblind-like protein 3 isoform X1 [Amphibalanus amphitrite]|uniref:muscleblind-like protein 3 isoform X1 n=1 Tax=Amphibalanus amphitrite TaxID=1232801 RepID=UPI001C926B08|nr:muscleblind-like protein 3 isoform X1 [Amphibalanus amphitrite]XP_043198069.1 muscleblind-like protein 3 isoform X1 [Amphibalanus amphitrite]XP_043198070.1 muscleblind-like protein 3 isoform X1 [Amphibalanus amphitrite]